MKDEKKGARVDESVDEELSIVLLGGRTVVEVITVVPTVFGVVELALEDRNVSPTVEAIAAKMVVWNLLGTLVAGRVAKVVVLSDRTIDARGGIIVATVVVAAEVLRETEEEVLEVMVAERGSRERDVSLVVGAAAVLTVANVAVIAVVMVVVVVVVVVVVEVFVLLVCLGVLHSA